MTTNGHGHEFVASFFGRPCQQRAVCCAKRLCIRPTEIEPKFDTETQLKTILVSTSICTGQTVRFEPVEKVKMLVPVSQVWSRLTPPVKCRRPERRGISDNNRERKCAKLYQNNTSLFLKNCNQHFRNFKP